MPDQREQQPAPAPTVLPKPTLPNPSEGIKTGGERAVDVLMRERNEAQRDVIALVATLRTAAVRLALYGAPYEDVTAVLSQVSGRTLDVAALLAHDPDVHTRVWRYIQEQIESNRR